MALNGLIPAGVKIATALRRPAMSAGLRLYTGNSASLLSRLSLKVVY